MSARRWCIAFAIAVALPGPARATDDGGTVGAFATGAGNRALAMGGASTALADGPWGWTWNPAGLAWLSRAGAEVAQGAPDAIGAHETQAALAVPDWRWGALALSWRQFGVDDLDGRDDRGASTGSFTDRETELGVAYGRTLTPALGMGVAVKLRRQAIAGRSGGGVGADVGGSLRLAALAGDDGAWWRDLTFGARLANVVRPAVRLDRDEVTEPGSVAGGIAWTRGPGATTIRLAADVERTAGLRPRGRIGFELGLLRSLELRAGWDGSRLTAGTAMAWRGLDVTYAYRDHPLGNEQRIGLGWRFGRTVSESRELAAAAGERQLQQRLQAAFDEDLERRAQSLYADASQALAGGSLDEAWDKASVLSAIAPTRADVAPLMSRILVARAAQLERAGDWDGARVEYEKALAILPGDAAGVAGAARCREHGDRAARRGAEQRRLVDAVLRGIAAGDPFAARTRLDSLRSAGLADSALAPLQLRLERLTAAQLDGRLEQVQRLVQSGLFDEAAAVLERARALAPNSPAVARARDQLARARPAARAAAGPAATPARAQLSEAARREAARLYESGLSALRAGRNDEAVRSWELAVIKDPQHVRARELLKREYQTRGLDAFSAGRLALAVDAWQRALQLDPADARTRSYLDRAQEHLSRSAELGVAR
jgi:tetratricopeptide (TPR) repeat protein